MSDSPPAARRSSAQTRQRILEAALGELAAGGLEKLSTNRIARRASVNIATLYKHFDNKYEILTELALGFSRKQSDLICRRLSATPLDATIETVCGGLVDALVDGTRGEKALAHLQRALMVIPELQSAYRLTNVEIAKAMSPFLERWGIRLEAAQLEVAMASVGEACAALQDLALSRDPRYDPQVIDELKLMLTAYYQARVRRSEPRQRKRKSASDA